MANWQTITNIDTETGLLHVLQGGYEMIRCLIVWNSFTIIMFLRLFSWVSSERWSHTCLLIRQPKTLWTLNTFVILVNEFGDVCLDRSTGQNVLDNGQWSHFYDVSPIWVFRCDFKWPDWPKTFGHWSHFYGFSPEWILRCVFRDHIWMVSLLYEFWDVQ